MNRVKELRLKNGLQQKDVAIALNIQQPSVSRWEQQKADPADENVTQLAELFHVDPSEIVYYAPKAWNAEYPAGVAFRQEKREELSEDAIEAITRRVQERMGVAPSLTPSEQEMVDDFRQLSPTQKSRIRAMIAGYLDAKSE